MKPTTIFSALNFSLTLALAFLLGSSLVAHYGVMRGAHIGVLLWALIILFTPLPNGRILFGIRAPWWLDPAMWGSALTVTLASLWLTPKIFYKHTGTHLLHYLITTPNPYWLVLFACALPMLVRTKKQSTTLHMLLVLIATGVTLALAYKPFILMLNSHRMGP